MPSTYEAGPDGRGWHAVDERPRAAADPVLEARLRELRQLAWLLDARFRIPGTGWRIGLDGLIGVIPGIGDGLPMLAGAWIIWRSAQLGMPQTTLLRMVGNLLIDAAAGSVPVLGDVFDVAFKANLRNLDLLHEHFGLPPMRR